MRALTTEQASRARPFAERRRSGMSARRLLMRYKKVVASDSGLRRRGGEREIRTLAPVSRPTPLAGEPLRPKLGYFSIAGLIESEELAERTGFEPAVPLGITSFQDWLHKPLGHLSAKQVSRNTYVVYQKSLLLSMPIFFSGGKAGRKSYKL